MLNATVFKTEHRAIAPVHRDVPNATRHLATVDRKLAGQAIAEHLDAFLDLVRDVYRAGEQLRDKMKTAEGKADIDHEVAWRSAAELSDSRSASEVIIVEFTGVT